MNIVKIIDTPLLRYWNYEKNDIDPIKVSASESVKKFWWFDTKCSHSWKSTPKSIGIFFMKENSPVCVYCFNRELLLGFNDVATTHPFLLTDWDSSFSDNPKLTEMTARSIKRVYWKCEKDHQYVQSINDKIRGRGCPICSGKRVLQGFNDVATTHPQFLSEWDDSHPENLKLTEITAFSNKKIYWRCQRGHEYSQAMNDKSQGKGCGICSNNRVLVGFNDVATTHPQFLSEWDDSHPENLKLTEITASSGKKVYWKCEKGHKYPQAMHHKSKGVGCPTCSNKVILQGFNDVATTHPQFLSEWDDSHPENLKLTEITAGSEKKLHWKCEKGHKYSQTMGNKTHGYGCARCSAAKQISQQEQTLYEFAKSLVPDSWVIQSDRSVLKIYEIDVYIPNLSVGIEYNGLYWHSEARGKDKSYHKHKWFQASQMNVHLLQIWEDDWVNSQDQIQTMLTNFLINLNEDNTTTLSSQSEIIEINNSTAEDFITKYSIYSFISGDIYLALQEDGQTSAVMTLRWNSDNVEILDIVTYVASKPEPQQTFFGKFLDYLEKLYTPSKFSVTTDNCFTQETLYIQNGFDKKSQIEPDYTYLVKGSRVPKENLTLEYFKADPKLEYDESFTVEELAYFNNLHKIWDAGKTVWEKNL